ncbi:MAG: iron hydrogenase [Candidatus Pacebacteria bacterium]|nr:iron hydrogenase [Candidatus Paceibacterota bacterium]
MNQTEISAIKYDLIRIAVLLGISILAPLFHQQHITGSIVNAVLFISVIVLGVQKAVIIGLIPSLVSLSIGFLPVILFPMIPFIMISNVILILTFDYLKKNFIIGVISASILKFLFLYFSSDLVIKMIIKKELALSVSSMMSWPQLFTALSGGIIAYLFLKTTKRI